MNNRLGDIPAWALEDSDDEANGGGGDIEMGSTPNNEMDQFFREVDGIKADIDAVGSAAKMIDKINEQAMRATTTAEENRLSQQLKPLVDNTNKRAKRTKNLLSVLKEETEVWEKDKSKKYKSSDLRVRKNMTTTLTRKFVDEMKLYQQAQQQYKSDIKKKVKRQVLVIDPEATDDDVDKVLRSEGGRDALYKKKILAGGVNDQIK